MIISQREGSRQVPTRRRRADRDVDGSLGERELSAERDRAWHECCGLGAVQQQHLNKTIDVRAPPRSGKAPWLAHCDVADL